MKKIILLMLVAVFAVTMVAGCGMSDPDTGLNNQGENPSAPEPAPGDNPDSKEETISLGGISLGDSQEKVLEVLGDQYEERYNEEPAYYGEPQLFFNYDSGINVILGADSKKVLEVNVEKPEFSTGTGEKVGDQAQEVLDKYRGRFEEFQGANSDGKLIGWFQLDKEKLIIFDFGQFQGTEVKNPTDQDTIKTIRLAYIKHFD